jgi:hypothetical protein
MSVKLVFFYILALACLKQTFWKIFFKVFVHINESFDRFSIGRKSWSFGGSFVSCRWINNNQMFVFTNAIQPVLTTTYNNDQRDTHLFEQRPLFFSPKGGRCTQVWLYLPKYYYIVVFVTLIVKVWRILDWTFWTGFFFSHMWENV